MARYFNGGSTDRVVVSDAVSIDDLTTWTVIVDLYANTKPQNARVFFKAPTGQDDGKQIIILDGGIYTWQGRATLGAEGRCNEFSVPQKRWFTIAVSYNEAFSFRIYGGDIQTPMHELGYAGGALGEGATDTGEDDLWIGNRESDAARAFDGAIGRFQFFDEVLSLAEIRGQAERAYDIPSCVCWLQLGDGTELDLSGNGNDVASVTGTSIVSDPVRPRPRLLPVSVPSERPKPRIIQRAP